MYETSTEEVCDVTFSVDWPFVNELLADGVGGGGPLGRCTELW